MKKKVVINSCYGGFSLSHTGVMEYAKLKGIELYGWIGDSTKKIYSKYGKEPTLDNPESALIHYCTKPVNNETEYKKLKGDKFYWSDRSIDRDDPALIQTIKNLKKKANGHCANLRIIEIPDNVEWQIEEYDGFEHIAEKHKTWN